MAEDSTRPGWLRAMREVAGVFAATDASAVSALAGVLSSPEGRVFFTGQGRSGLVARMGAMRFMHLGRDVHAVGEATSPSVRGGDTLVVVSGSGSTAVSLAFARIARDVGARVVLITATAGSEIEALAGATLVLSTAGSAQFGGTLFEQSALIALDAAVDELAAGIDGGHERMGRNHTNLQ